MSDVINRNVCQQAYLYKDFSYKYGKDGFTKIVIGQSN